MKNLLKNSIFSLLLLVVSCQTSYIPQETIEAFGYYAYKKNDTVIVLKNSYDTIIYNLDRKTKDMMKGFYSPEIEFIELHFIETYTTINSFSYMHVFIEGDQGSNLSLDTLFFNHIEVKDLLSKLEIDGVSYDSVYYMQDEVAGYEMYSSKNYGFIKIWNDTISYKFMR